MPSALPNPPVGANPYEFYLDFLHDMTVPMPSDPSGFRARLIVLFITSILLLVTSAGNFALHAWSYRLTGRRIWFFKLAERGDGGRHIMSNHFVLCGLAGIALFPVFFGNVYTLYVACISQRESEYHEDISKWSYTIWAPVYAAAWLLSWATFQAYLQIESGSRTFLRSKAGGRVKKRCCGTMPVWLEHALFLGGGLAALAVHITLSSVGGVAASEMWRQYHVLTDMLKLDAEQWTGGGIPEDHLVELIWLLRRYFVASRDFYNTASNMCIGAAVLPVLLILVNFGMFSFVWMIRRTINVQLAQLPAVLHLDMTQVSMAQDPVATCRSRPPCDVRDEPLPGEGSKPSTAPTSPTLASHVLEPELALASLPPFPRDIVPDPESDKGTSSPAPSLPPPAIPFSPFNTQSVQSSPRLVTHDPLTGAELRSPRPVPTRAQVVEMAGDVEAAATGAPEQQMASRITALIKAETELLAIGLTVIVIATSLSIYAIWSTPTLRNWRQMTWSKQEAVLTVPLWICTVGLSIAETVHAWIEWKFVVGQSWRRERYEARERKSAASAALDDGGDRLTCGAVASPGLRTTRIAPSPVHSKQSRSGRAILGRGLGLSLGASSGGVGTTSGESAHRRARRLSHAPTVNFDGAISIAVEVTQKEEVDEDVPALGDESPLEVYGSAPMIMSPSLGGRSMQSGSADIDSARRKEAWED